MSPYSRGLLIPLTPRPELTHLWAEARARGISPPRYPIYSRIKRPSLPFPLLCINCTHRAHGNTLIG